MRSLRSSKSVVLAKIAKLITRYKYPANCKLREGAKTDLGAISSILDIYKESVHNLFAVCEILVAMSPKSR